MYEGISMLLVFCSMHEDHIPMLLVFCSIQKGRISNLLMFRSIYRVFLMLLVRQYEMTSVRARKEAKSAQVDGRIVKRAPRDYVWS
jgi:hypothetical protein